MRYSTIVEKDDKTLLEIIAALEQYFCDTYRGRYSLLVWSAVSKERKDQRESGITDRGAAATFQQMIEKLQEEAAAV